MAVFDDILPVAERILASQGQTLTRFPGFSINRDLTGRVRLIVDASLEQDETAVTLIRQIAEALYRDLGPHAYPPAEAVLWEPEGNAYRQGGTTFKLESIPNVTVIDRLAVDSDWSDIREIANGPPRIVFYSIKGGVGRSTSIAVVARHLARHGKRVLVLDMDLESPGLTSVLLPEALRPRYGVADWLVEDLVDNGEAVLDSMVAASPITREGDVDVVAGNGVEVDTYILKLGRVWMPKTSRDGLRQSWPVRLGRMLNAIIERRKPDVVLIDSRSGIDEIAATCLAGLGATQALLFALDGEQTWNGYRMILRHWRRTDVVRSIRERLQIVGAMVPELERAAYLGSMRDNAWTLFQEELYDDVAPDAGDDLWNFDRSDETAPHFPRKVLWHRGLSGLPNLYGGIGDLSDVEITAIFGDLIDTVVRVANGLREAE